MKLSILSALLIFAFSFSAFAQVENERDKGVELYRQGEYSKAVELLQKSIKTDDKDRLAWLYLGASFVKLKNDAEALKAFRKSEAAFGKNLPVYDKKLKIVSRPRPASLSINGNNTPSGIVQIAVEFGADGKIGFVFPFEGLSTGQTENIVKSVRGIKFESAVQNGKPVVVISVLQYNFSTF